MYSKTRPPLNKEVKQKKQHLELEDNRELTGMYSLLSRGNALLAYAFTYLAVAATVCFVTTIVPPAAPQIQLTVHQPLV